MDPGIRRDRRAVLGRMLRLSLLEHDWQRPAPGMAEVVAGAPIDGLTEAAEAHGVAGFVHLSLRGVPGVHEPTRHALELGYQRGLQRHLRALADLRRVTRVLDGLGVPWLVVKGPVLSASVYARPDLRTYNDIDVVVQPGDLRSVLMELRGQGARLADGRWVLRGRGAQGEVDLALPYGTFLDLHWHLLNDAELRQGFSIPMPELFDRARPVEVDGTALHTLDPVDTLVYLGLHACLAGGNRLVWVKDLERCVAVDRPHWGDVVERARQWGAGPALAHSLAHARRLAAEVPDGVLGALAGSRAWDRTTRLLCRLWPVERAGDGPAPARLIARSVRPDPWSTSLAVGRQVAAGIGRRMPLGPPPDTSYIDHVGSEEQLGAFLQAVESAGAGTVQPGR